MVRLLRCAFSCGGVKCANGLCKYFSRSVTANAMTAHHLSEVKFLLSGTSFRSTMEAVPANCLRDVRPLALRACVIGIDEGQFVSLSIYLHFTFTPLFFVFFSPFLKKILYCYLSDFKIKSFFFY